MSKKQRGNDEHLDFPSPKGMQGWLEREIEDIQKAATLRIKDASGFVGAYMLGEISSQQAAERANSYAERWGDALPGVLRSRGMTDDQILKHIDEAGDPRFVDRILQKQPASREAKKRS